MNRYTERAALLITIIFSLISLLHFYWAFGGQLWFESVLPTNSTGVRLLNPSRTASLVVALGLLGMAFVTVGTLGLFDRFLNRNYFRYGTLLISLIFLLRAIGDFKFVGFFKTVTETKFGVNDTVLFSPLCLVISVGAFWIFVFSRKVGTRFEV